MCVLDPCVPKVGELQQSSVSDSYVLTQGIQEKKEKKGKEGKKKIKKTNHPGKEHKYKIVEPSSVRLFFFFLFFTEITEIKKNKKKFLFSIQENL